MKKKRGPKADAVKKWSERLKKIGNQTPPEELVKIINGSDAPKKIAKPRGSGQDLDI